MASYSNSEGELGSATVRPGITTSGCFNAYNLEPARQAGKRETGLHLVLVTGRYNYFFPIDIYKFSIPLLYVAIFT